MSRVWQTGETEFDRETCTYEIVWTYSIRLDHKTIFEFFWPSEVGTLKFLFLVVGRTYYETDLLPADSEPELAKAHGQAVVDRAIEVALSRRPVRRQQDGFVIADEETAEPAGIMFDFSPP